jgi:hypothetical protein
MNALYLLPHVRPPVKKWQAIVQIRSETQQLCNCLLRWHVKWLLYLG